MSKRVRTAPEPSPAVTSNPAVAHCRDVWDPVYNAALARGRHIILAAREAAPLYRNAMPALTGYQQIQDFIACTAHGILVGAIEPQEASRLLYAAQIAMASVRNQPAPPNPGPEV